MPQRVMPTKIVHDISSDEIIIATVYCFARKQMPWSSSSLLDLGLDFVVLLATL